MAEQGSSDTAALARRVRDLAAKIRETQQAVRTLAVAVTVLLLTVGQFLPFFVAAKEFHESATLWNAMGKEAPSVVADPGGGWFVPIAATWIVAIAMLVLSNPHTFSDRGARWVQMVARVLSIMYLIGCLLGLLVLGAEVESGPDTVAASPGMATLVLGAAMAVVVSCSRLSSHDFGRVAPESSRYPSGGGGDRQWY